MKIRDKPVDKALGLLISESTNGKVKPNLCKIYSKPNNEVDKSMGSWVIIIVHFPSTSMRKNNSNWEDVHF